MRANPSRRSLLKLGVGGSVAASLPQATLAAPRAEVCHSTPLSDREQLDVCFRQIDEILGRLHPLAEGRGYFYFDHEDGTYNLGFHCQRRWLPWTGPGLYRISMGGYLSRWWLERVERRAMNGRVYLVEFEGWNFDDHESRYIGGPRPFHEARIVEKLDGLPPPRNELHLA